MPELADDLAHAAHVWLLQTAGATDPARLAEAVAILSPDETERYRAFRFEADRQLYLAAHAMLRRVLSRYADVAPAEWRFARGAQGRPEINTPQTGLSLRFNLSHTRGLAACVVTRTVDCGIDVEAISRHRNITGIAQRMFAAEEVRALQGLPDAARLERFFTCWTLREAYCKARGSGLAGSGTHFRFEPDDEGAWYVRVAGRPAVSTDWLLDVQRVFDTHMLAVAVHTGDSAVRTVRVRAFGF